MENLSLHHVGIVAPTEQYAQDLMSLLGLEEEHRGYVPEYKSLCIFTKGNDASQVEFVIPSGGNLAGFNAGKGGLHHIAFTTGNVKAVQQEFQDKGFELLEEIPVQGAGNFIVNFLKPRYTSGILVEFVELVEK